MNPIRTLANLYGCIAYAIGPERWIPRLTQRVLCSVRTEEKKIALTFDDGPNPKYTPLLLTKLAEHCVSATFFLIGRNLLHFPRKPIGEQAPADEISPPHLRGRELPQPWSVR